MISAPLLTVTASHKETIRNINACHVILRRYSIHGVLVNIYMRSQTAEYKAASAISSEAMPYGVTLLQSFHGTWR
jgi:hypothetical protein